MPESVEEFELIGNGLTVYAHDSAVEGPVVWLDSPTAVMEFVQAGNAAETIVLARGGTTTFLTPALTAGVKGVMTLQGAPESHLGILSREYGIPCLMSVKFTEGVKSSRGEIIPPDGAIVRLDVTTEPEGSVAIESSARTYDLDVTADDEVELDPEAAAAAAAQAEQIAVIMANFHGQIPGGPAGDRQIRSRMKTNIIETSSASVRGGLSGDERDDFLTYVAWNLWDVIAARQTEGESGLIPRQEYETMSFVQQWATYGKWYGLIQEEIGADGVIELGRTPRKEIGSKVNHVHMWCGACPLIGRGLATSLGLETGTERIEDIDTIAQFTRQMQNGLWGDGLGYVSARGYKPATLDDSWIQRFREEENRFSEPEELDAFRRFNAATELCGFLLHYDCRAGLCDTGPYPLPDGGFMIVRDHFLYDPGYEWTGVVSDLPHAVTEAIFFRPTEPVEITINDIATTFARPRNYLKYLSGAVVYARDKWDTPMSQIRKLDAAEMARIEQRCNEAMLELYATIGNKSRDERIMDGVKVYTRDMVMPYARKAGLWDKFSKEMEFDKLSDLAERAWPILTGGGGEAQQVLGGVMLLGTGIVPNNTLPPAPPLDPGALPILHAIALRGSMPSPPEGSAALEEAGLLVTTPAGVMLTAQGHTAHKQLLDAERSSVDLEKLATIYERFLAANGPFKALSAKAGSASEDEQFELAAQAGELIDRIEPVLNRSAELIPRFSGYATRMREALTRVDAGEWSYLISPQVDSIHTAWMECHEDYLQTLDRSREEEGSF